MIKKFKYLFGALLATGLAFAATNRVWESQEWLSGHITTPSNPAAGKTKMYFKSDNKLYKLTSGGVETEVGAGSGDFVGPASSTDNAVCRFDGTTGKLAQNSGVTISDSDILTAVGLNASNLTASRVVVTDGSKNLASSSVSSTTLGYLDATSSVQTQLDAKAPLASPTFTGTVTLPNDTVTNAMAANMAQSTIKGRAVSAGTGDPTDLTATQATAILDAFTGDSGSGGVKGLVPAPASGDATKFLKGNGTWGSGSVTIHYYTGYHGSGCSAWTRTSSSYGAITDDASGCTLTSRLSSGITAATSGSVSPALALTLTETGKYYVCAQVVASGGSAAIHQFRLWDGTTTIAENTQDTTSDITIPLCGLYNATGTSPTLTVQCKSSSGTCTIDSGASDVAIEWAIYHIVGT